MNDEVLRELDLIVVACAMLVFICILNLYISVACLKPGCALLTVYLQGPDTEFRSCFNGFLRISKYFLSHRIENVWASLF